jgi:hypothetical protein
MDHVDRYLHRAALTRSVSGAPAKCKLGRSLSKAIARFEEELGIHLVLRSTRSFPLGNLCTGHLSASAVCKILHSVLKKEAPSVSASRRDEHCLQ